MKICIATFASTCARVLLTKLFFFIVDLKLEGTAFLTEQEKTTISKLAVSWDLPGVTQENRKWLMEKMLLHAVSLIFIHCNEVKVLIRD